MGFLGSLVGSAVATFGCQDEKRFEQSAKLVISSQGIKPWDAGKLIRNRLVLQEALRRRCPLSQVPVEFGLSWFQDKVGGLMGGATMDQFVQVAKQLLASRNIAPHFSHDLDLADVYQSIDYDGSGRLSVGELAAGLAAFFKGTKRERDVCVFKLLDRDRRGYLSRPEFDEYLKPVVGLMVPADAAVLKPLLMRHAGDVLFSEVDVNQDQRCTPDSFLAWSAKEKSMVDDLQQLIETKVYKVWLDQNLRCSHHFW